MRSISLIALVLCAAGLAGCWITGGQRLETLPNAPLEWVRTSSGWEKPSTWPATYILYEPALHPLIVALGQTLVSVLALLAFDPASARPQRFPRRTK